MNARYGKHRWGPDPNEHRAEAQPSWPPLADLGGHPKGMAYPRLRQDALRLGGVRLDLFCATASCATDGWGPQIRWLIAEPLGVWRVASLDVNAPIIEVDFEVRNGHRVRTVFRLAT